VTDEYPKVRRVDGAEAAALVDALSEVLLDCVEGGASVSFMWPLPRERARAFWQGVAEGVKRGERLLFVGATQPGRIDGTVQVVLAQPDNQPHRADVAKMQVHPRARGRGLGAALLQAAEREAKRLGRTLLVLDTVTGSPASRLYERAGWVRVGDIPRYALFPDGRECATTYYYRDLRG
jgi:GNAT superfamily N-acetyltransferase